MLIRSLTEKLPWKKLIKFAFVGGGAFAIDFALYYLLTRFGHVNYLISRSISLAVATVWNFTLNRIWTFNARSGKVRQQAPRFLVVIGLTSLLSLFLMRIGVSVLHFHDLIVMIVVSLLIMFVNFFAHQFWSYRPETS